jgi:hypothetical protein
MFGKQDLRIWHAPEYFLDVAITQIGLIRDNWENVVNRAWKSMRVYEFDQVRLSPHLTVVSSFEKKKHPIDGA